MGENNYENCTKEELISKIRTLQAHNLQLRNIIAKSNTSVTSKKRPSDRPFNFENCKYRHALLKFFYLGWNHNGFVVQEDTTNTIENYIFEALQKTCLIEDRSKSNYHRCGRTDKGVSSFSQVISLDIRSECSKDGAEKLRYCKLLNRVLPDSIQCIAWSAVPDEFSARFDCVSRKYKYFFPKGDLDVEQMEKAASYLVGAHDFRNFCKMDVGNGVTEFTRRIDEISISLTHENQSSIDQYSMYVLMIRGKAFLWHQIRCIMSVLLLVGQKNEEPEIVLELLNVEKNSRKPDYKLSSEIGLNLYECFYEDVEWRYDEEALEIAVKKLQNSWTFSQTKSTMIQAMLEDLQSINTTDTNCLSDNLLQGAKQRCYVPLMKRQFCNSLEEKIKHFAKRKK